MLNVRQTNAEHKFSISLSLLSLTSNYTS